MLKYEDLPHLNSSRYQISCNLYFRNCPHNKKFVLEFCKELLEAPCVLASLMIRERFEIIFRFPMMLESDIYSTLTVPLPYDDGVLLKNSSH